MLTIPPLFFDARHFLSWASKVKSQPFWRKSQKSPKIVKNHEIFQKFDFYHPGSDWLPKRAHLCLIFDLLWKKKFFSYKNWDFLAIFLKKSISDPPNLSKSATTRSSIKKCHKEKVIFSPIQGRMQKIRKSYRIVFENMHRRPGPVIYVTTTRTGQGPYPALPDK